MASYCFRFISDYSTLSDPLRRLTRADTDSEWTFEQNSALENLKTLRSSDTVISYYNPNEDFNGVVDVSTIDVGALLPEEDQVSEVDFA